MSAVAAAVGVAGIGSAVIGGISSSNAANTEANASMSAQQVQMNEFNQQQANLAPYQGYARSVLGVLGDEMNGDTPQGAGLQRAFTMADFKQDPGYQFQLQQGTQAMQRSAAAAGMLNSTGTQENLNNYAQGMANTDYQQALTNFTNNQQQRYNMLTGITNMGMGANAQSLQNGSNMASNVGNLQMQAGSAMASGQMGVGNAVTSGLNSAANGYMNMSMMNGMNNAMAAGGGMNQSANLSMPQLGAQSAAPAYSLL